jgi:hypothetical protein
MGDIHVSFSVRLRADENADSIRERVGRVLSCSFATGQHPDYPDEVIIEAEAACLRFRLAHWPFYGDPALRIYQVNGENILTPRWRYDDELDLSQWMLQEFRRRDSPDWYIATVEELKQEAGLS